MSQARQARMEDLFARLGLKPSQPALYEEAFVHRSFLNESRAGRLASSERLEFLGDSVLGLVTSQYLYERYPGLAEGVLARRKATLVSESLLAGWARQMELGELLKFGKGEEQTGGRQKEALLADCFEAFLAAVYLDQGLDAAARLVRPFLDAWQAEAGEESDQASDAKTRLQERVQKRTKKPPAYRLLDAAGPDHAKTFEVEVSVAGKVLARGRGKSKKEAEQSAAREALQALERE